MSLSDSSNKIKDILQALDDIKDNKVGDKVGLSDDDNLNLIIEKINETQKEIQENNLFRNTFLTSPAMKCITKRDETFHKVNPAFASALGYTEDELLSRSFLEFIHHDDIEKTIKEIEKSAIEGYKSYNFENRYRCKDGSYIHLSWEAISIPGQNYTHAIAKDVTQRRAVENKLNELNNILNTEAIIAKTDISGTIIEVNDKFCEISGYQRDELVGQNHRILNSNKHPKSFFKDMWQTISSGHNWSGLIQNITKKGEYYFVQTIIAPLFDDNKKITSYLSIRYDATKFKAFEDRNTKMLKILNETNSIAKIGGWELDIRTGTLNWTDETFNILEVEKKHDQQPRLPEGLSLFTERCKPIIKEAVNRAIEHGEPYSLELEAKTAKGNIVWVYTNGKANYEDGKIVTISGTIQNIDQVKKTEQKYEQERMKSIHSSKLASLGEMSAGIAHEINNPLAIISGITSLLKIKKQVPDEIKSKIDTIEKSAERIGRIVNSLKKFTRSNGVSTRKAHKLKDIVNEALTLTDNKAKEKDTKLSFNDDTNSVILCDEIEIEQVLVNLINNSIDAIEGLEERWVKLEINEENSKVILKVTDSGSGIPKDKINNIFEPFFTTKDVGKGTGLGLSISKTLLDEHQAQIEIDSKSPNTCFVISFEKYEGKISEE